MVYTKLKVDPSDVDFDDPDWHFKDKEYRRTFLAYHTPNYVSQAPLHLAWPSTMCCPPAKMRELKAQGYEIKRGRFTKEEDKRIRKNWRRLIRFFPVLDDPIAIFTRALVLDKATNKIKLLATKNRFGDRPIKQNFQFCQGPLRLAYKLDNRLVCAVRKRAIVLFHEQCFEYNSAKNTPDNVIKAIRDRMKKRKQSRYTIAALENVSPQLLAMLKRHAPKDIPKFIFKPDDDANLRMCMSKVFENPDCVPTYMITMRHWKQVVEHMRECGYMYVRSEQMRYRWSKLNPNMVGLRDKSWEEVKEIIRKQSGGGNIQELQEVFLEEEEVKEIIRKQSGVGDIQEPQEVFLEEEEVKEIITKQCGAGDIQELQEVFLEEEETGEEVEEQEK